MILNIRMCSAAIIGIIAVSGALAQAPAKPSRPMDLTQPHPAEPEMPADTALQKANAYFNGAPTMIGDFTQVAADGKRSQGKIYVQRPGRIRFEYASPATLEIIADGSSVAIRDRKLATQDMYFIGQTPLKFLLKEKIDLRKDVKVLDVTSDKKTVVISVEDKATFGGTSRIKLIFDTRTFSLKQWQVTDPQGYETMVSLFNINFTEKPDPSLFKIDMERFTTPN